MVSNVGGDRHIDSRRAVVCLTLVLLAIPCNSNSIMETKSPIEVKEKTSVSQDHVADDSVHKAERRLRTKIDFFVVPTVTLLYLMCFIDRSNIGKLSLDQ